MSWLAQPKISPIETRIHEREFALPVIRFTSHIKPAGAPTVQDIRQAVRAGQISRSFFEAFGTLGVVIVLVVLISITWTLGLIILTVAPNKTANYLTQTTEFDGGNFWLIIDPDPVFLVVSSLSLGVLVLLYIDVLLKLSVQRNVIRPMRPFRFLINVMCPGRKSHSQFERNLLAFWYDLTAFNGRRRNFDMVFAVGWPMLWLGYSVDHFDFDRAKALLYLKVYPPGWFERKARLMADTVTITLFQISFDALRMKSVSDLLLRMVMNLSFCYRLKRAVEFLIRRHRQKHRRTKSFNLVKTVHQPNLPRPIALIFFAFSVSVVVATHMSIMTSEKACYAYPQCAVYAYRWKSNDLCPCRALIDVECAPHAYNEWIHPPEVTNLVSMLAKSGDLRIIQIINRQLPVWPPDLQRCTGLRSMYALPFLRTLLTGYCTNSFCLIYRFRTLMYTGISVIPEWAATFRNLELLYVHPDLSFLYSNKFNTLYTSKFIRSIEGRPIDTNLVSLPGNLFDSMLKLTHLHLAVHQNLVRIPPLDGLANLKSLTLAIMMSLVEIPPLENLTKLQLVQVFGANKTQRIPNLSPDVGSVSLLIADSMACCNGYITCNLSSYLCSAHPSCLDKAQPENRPNEVTQHVFDLMTAKTCTTSPYKAADFFKTPTEEDVDNCGGVLYAQCQKFNGTARIPGMCYNERMQVISCQTMKLFKIARIQEIEFGVGFPCDAINEKYLGCGAPLQVKASDISRKPAHLGVLNANSTSGRRQEAFFHLKNLNQIFGLFGLLPRAMILVLIVWIFILTVAPIYQLFHEECSWLHLARVNLSMLELNYDDKAGKKNNLFSASQSNYKIIFSVGITSNNPNGDWLCSPVHLQSVDGRENLLSVDEIAILEPLVAGAAPPQGAVMPPPDNQGFAALALERARHLRQTTPRFVDHVATIARTANIVERFFSQANAVVGMHRQAMTPLHLESILFPR
ncbi:unnamed protein product [Phytophthora fragariaefolia]|uniref:Unnamed protein product n=1 Tax=Phytophthora fragariaefolia TaxID=1490495 RepID=A0A9W6WSF8_9STRA|nr:unnamed protein product [Phytophthora fragariaefolia]